MGEKMQIFQQKVVHKICRILLRPLHYIQHKDVDDVVIASAVRTPITGFGGYHPALSATQLGAVAIEGALKQSALPHEAVQQVYFGNVLAAGVGQAPARQATLMAGLFKSACCTTVSASNVTGIKTIMFAAQAVKLGLADAAIAGGMESLSHVPYYMPRTQLRLGDVELADGLVVDVMTENPVISFQQKFGITKEDCIKYTDESNMRFRKASSAGLFDLELVPLRIMQKSRIPIVITEDEQRPLPNSVADEKKGMESCAGDGAAALVLTTNEMARKWNLKPLARILGYNESEADDSDFVMALVLAVKRLLQHFNYKIDDVALWELDDSIPGVLLAVMKELNISQYKVNVHGGSACLGHPIAMSGARLVTHLTHALQPGQIGCAAITNEGGNAAALLIQKISYDTDNVRNKMPLLSLYTKDDCELCDDLVKELEIYFDGQFKLEKVDISKKENVRFLRLYRYDIPVLFFNGQFLCMHKLNINLMGKKMKEWRMKNN